MRKHYNYFRDYDPNLGGYLSSDPTGLSGGLNTFNYAASSPLNLLDLRGLTYQDVQGVYHDVLGSFSDLKPSSNGVALGSLNAGNLGETSWAGQIFVDPAWADKRCFTKDEYTKLFFTLFHEGMHSTDPLLTRINTKNDLSDRHHLGIYNREGHEQGGYKKPPSPIWGTPRPSMVDMAAMYDRYRRRTPGCACP